MVVTTSQVLGSDVFLRTIDNPTPFCLLKDPDAEPATPSISFMHEQSGLFLIELDNVVSSAECEQMIKLDDPKSYRSVTGRYEISKRQGSRLLAIDERTSSIFWDRIQIPIASIVSDKSIPLTPLGFDVSAGEWRLDGLNEALRVNLYDSSSDFFSPHVDAQYCPSGDRRSRFSVVVYLTDEFDKGETTFYFPKEPLTAETALKYKGLTIDEEVSARGGIAEGFDAITIKPKKGSAVVFSQNIIHEATPLAPRPDTSNPQRIIIRTDVMVKRVIGMRGFVVSEAETKDYQMALSYFREAQQMELKKNVEKAGELYERCLSIRYSYPMCLVETTKMPWELCWLSRLPPEIMARIAEKMSPLSAQKLVLAFPNLLWIQSLTELHHTSFIQNSFAFKQLKSVEIFRSDPKRVMVDDELGVDSSDFCWPDVSNIKGSSCGFYFDDIDFFKANIEGCCRAIAMLAFFEMGDCVGTYTVSYNPVTQEVKKVDFKEIVAAAFYNKPCYGSIFKVVRKTPFEVDPRADFEHSVDRTYMTRRFGSQFVGSDYIRNSHVHLTEVDAEPEESDKDDEDEEDDDMIGSSNPSLFKDLSTPYKNWDSPGHSWSSFFKELSRIERFTEDFPDLGPWDFFDVVDAEREEEKVSTVKQWGDTEGGREQSYLIDLNDAISPCFCPLGDPVSTQLRPINDLVFDFSRSSLTVTPEESFEVFRPDSCRSCPAVEDGPGKTFRGASDADILRFKVDITPLSRGDQFESFNHASCQCSVPNLDANVLEVVAYHHLDHVHLRCWENGEGKMLIYAAYGGIAAL
ncbi:hypothetical protein HDU97_001543 [Phlyctochytrium planicorne]|nr:hypothetical protein HDU97_001543 [Phlyctochytrium planicorne]